MQFRNVKNKVQCLISVYDRETKRTRQKMIHSLNLFGGNEPPKPDDLDFGDKADRVTWASEIADYLNRKAAENDKRSRDLVPRRFSQAVQSVRAIDDLTNDEKQMILKEAEALIAFLRPKKSGGAKGFGDNIKARAQQLRETHTVAKTAEILVSEGHKVSKAWVQKWTT